jgi:hypothetical protein
MSSRVTAAVRHWIAATGRASRSYLTCHFSCHDRPRRESDSEDHVQRERSSTTPESASNHRDTSCVCAPVLLCTCSDGRCVRLQQHERRMRRLSSSRRQHRHRPSLPLAHLRPINPPVKPARGVMRFWCRVRSGANGSRLRRSASTARCGPFGSLASGFFPMAHITPVRRLVPRTAFRLARPHLLGMNR